MAKNKKAKTTSLEAQVQAIQAGFKTITPPDNVQLEDKDLPFFNNVIAEFAKSEWSDHQLEIAAMLARTMADLEQEQRALRSEGFISTRQNGTTVENPRSRITKSLTGDILSLRRSLALHARARGDNLNSMANKTNRLKQAEAIGQELSEDSLIAQPSMN